MLFERLTHPISDKKDPASGLHLAPPPSRPRSAVGTSAAFGPGIVLIAARRCASFFAEAAVLVLVFGILDYFMLKGRVELAWIVGALLISLGLLTGSILMDLSAQRWIKTHP